MSSFLPLPLNEWEESKITLHLWLQIVGKIKLDLATKRNHWWHITFHLNTKGLTTGSIPYGAHSFQIDFNLRDHQLEVLTSWGEERKFPLVNGLSVAKFHETLFTILNELGIKTVIKGTPYDHPCTDPFEKCIAHNQYNAKYVNRFWEVLLNVDHVFHEFSGRFCGKMSPSQLYWHHMDLAVTRFSGKRGPELSESATHADKEAYSHEVISAGFWAGDENVRGAAFYAYTYPSPKGLEKEAILPEKANWVDSNGSPMALLMYDDLIQEENPKQALLDFLESTYQAGAKVAQWSNELNV